MFTKKQKTLKQHLVGALVRAVVIPLSFLTSFLIFSSINQSTTEMEFVSPETPAAQSIVEGSPADLITKHGCWTGEAPADMEGVLPGHVVVTKDGATAPVYGGSRLVGKALEQIFEGKNHNLTVHGFCR